MAAERGPVLGGQARLRDGPRQRAIHGAGIQQTVPEPSRQLAGHRRLARSRRTVDGDHRLPSRSVTGHYPSTDAHGSPASAFSTSANWGNEVAMQSVSSMSVSPWATRPATASAMAMR